MTLTTRYKPYAKAFFAFVYNNANNSLDRVYNDALMLSDALSQGAKLKKFLKSKNIDSETKLNLLIDVFSDLSTETKRLLKVLNNNKRLGKLDSVLSNFIDIYHKEKNITKVYITLASQPNPAIIEDLEDQISTKLKTKIIPHININKEIIGGFIISFNSNIYNASIANSLTLIKSKLLENS